MNTIVTNWQIVTVIKEEKPITEALWAIVIEDANCKLSTGNYVCTSQIETLH
ncbi:MAG: hypothetical protein ACI83B_001836 [Sediminicola sp.]|jgi:hypothetical protein